MGLQYFVNLFLFKRKWKKMNRDNGTTAINLFDAKCVEVGKFTYGGINVSANNSNAKLYIGNYCSIAPDVSFFLSSEHNINTITTFPHKVKTLGIVKKEAASKGDIIVGDDVWIGYGAIILSGVHIGQGAVIAAGAVVTKDVPPYAIVGGVPAQVIKYRFSSEIIEQMMRIDYSKLTKEMIQDHLDDLYREVDEQTDFSWLPKKV